MSENRVTPYDIIFGGAGFDDSHFELMREQAAVQPATSAVELFMLPSAGTLLKDLLPEDTADTTHRELVDQVTALLFQAFRYWLHGRRVWEITEPAARAVLERVEPVGEWSLQPPAPAGYVQLPRNLLWARVTEDAAPEPADGFFWSAPTSAEGVRSPRLDVLLALGVRPGRPGISAVDVSIEGADALQHWADVEARPGGVDFENVLPGGELQGYHSLTTRAEVLKLVARCFWLVERAGADTAGSADGTRRVIHG